MGIASTFKPLPSMNPLLRLALGGLALGLASSQALGAEDARVLPQGRSRFSLIYGLSGTISRTYNDEGKSESVAAPYNMELSGANLRRFDDRMDQLVSFLNDSGYHYNANQRANGSYGITSDPEDPRLGDALSRGTLNVGIEAQRQQFNFAYGFGITDRLSLGLTIPFVRTQVYAEHSLAGANTADDIYYGFVAKQPGVYDEIRDALNLLRSLDAEKFQSLLVERGYSRFRSTETSGMGDVILGSRYQYLDVRSSAGDRIHSAQLGLTVPTGRLARPGVLTEIDHGKGAWDLGASHLVSYTPFRELTLTNSLNYVRRFWGSRAMRVRRHPGDFLPDSSSEEDVRLRLGDKTWVFLGAKLNLTDVFSVDTGYEWFWKGRDLHEGARADRDYSYLGDRTDQYLETLNFGASASSIPAFMRSRFPVPAQFSLSLFLPVRGRNSYVAPYGTAELALYL